MFYAKGGYLCIHRTAATQEMIKILRKVSFRLHLQIFYNASTSWSGVKMEKEVVSRRALLLKPSVSAQGHQDVAPWSWVGHPVSPQDRKPDLHKPNSITYKTGVCSLGGFIVLMIGSECQKKFPSRSASGESHVLVDRGPFSPCGHRAEAGGKGSPSF